MSFLPVLLCLYCLLLLLLTVAVHAQQLAPIGTAVNPLGTTRVDQTAYDPTNRTLYFAASLINDIIQVVDASAVPLTPSNAAPWGYAVVAGTGANGFASVTEVPPTVATFWGPTGVVGWPQYAVQPYTTRDSSVGTPAAWVGLWIADNGNNALRFLHFFRGRNVTLVAGSNTRAFGTTDGVGIQALLYGPVNLAWGRFLRRTAADGKLDLIHPAWTTVVFWSDQRNHCLRQGVPLHNDSYRTYFSPTTTLGDLSDMVLNVSSFAGFCGGGSGSAVGPAYNTTGLFWYPWGVALVVPAVRAVLFIGEASNYRVSMIAPMYPLTARYLAVISTNPYMSGGVTIARIQQRASTNAAVVLSTVEIFVGTYSSGASYKNITVPLSYNRTTKMTTFVIGSVSQKNVATTFISSTLNTAFVRYAPNSSYNGTLVVFSGYGGAESLDYYCCLSVEYAALIELQDGEVAPPTRTWSPTKTPVIQTLTAGSTETLTATATTSGSSTSTSSTSSSITNTLIRSRDSKTQSSSATRTGMLTTTASAASPSLFTTLTSASKRKMTGSLSSTRSRKKVKKITPTPSLSHPTTSSSSPTSSLSYSSTPRISPTATFISFSSSVTSSRLVYRRRRLKTKSDSLPSVSPARRPWRGPTPTAFLLPPLAAAVPVAVQVSIATVGSTINLASSGGGTGIATALATMGLAERCLVPLWQENADVPLAFPSSVVPPWRLGDTVSSYPRLPYYRAAAVGSLLAHVLAAAIAGTAAFVMVRAGWGSADTKRWYQDVAMRLPVVAVVAVDGLFLDGGVGGGATAVQAGGVMELGYLCCGLLGPVATIVGLSVLTWRRVAHYDAAWLIQGAPLPKRQALAANRATALGALHRWVVGMGAWRDNVEGGAPSTLLLAAYGKYRGPSAASPVAATPPLSSFGSPATPYFTALCVANNIILSGVRGVASSDSCVTPSAIVAAFCTAIFLAFLALRPMTSVVKNIVVIGLSAYAAANAWVLLVAAVQGSSDLLFVALLMAEYQVFLGGINVAVIMVSFGLSRWASNVSITVTTPSAAAAPEGIISSSLSHPSPPPPPLLEEGLLHQGHGGGDGNGSAGVGRQRESVGDVELTVWLGSDPNGGGGGGGGAPQGNSTFTAASLSLCHTNTITATNTAPGAAGGSCDVAASHHHGGASMDTGETGLVVRLEAPPDDDDPAL